jgi:uncharacterized coiled-coil protein SlyX
MTAHETAGDGRGRAISPEAARLEEQIAETRRQLGETVEALAHKVDVRAQAQEKVSELRGRLKGRQDSAKAKASELGGQATARRAPIAGIAVAIALVVALVWRLRRG